MDNYVQTRNNIMGYTPPTTYTEVSPVLNPVRVQQAPVPYTQNPAAVYNLNHLVGYPTGAPHVVHGTPVNVENYRFLGGGGMTADLYNQVAADTMNALRLLGGGSTKASTPRSGGSSKAATPTPKPIASVATTPTTGQTLSAMNSIQPEMDTVPTFDPNQLLLAATEAVAHNGLGTGYTTQAVNNPNNTTLATFGTQTAYAPQQAFSPIRPNFRTNNVTQPTFDPNSTLASVVNTANTQPVITPLPAHEVATVPKAPTPINNKLLAPIQVTPNLLRELLNSVASLQYLPVQ